MSTSPALELHSDVYRWRKNEKDEEKRILVKMFYKTSNLQRSDDQTLWRKYYEENGIDVDAAYLKTLFDNKKYFPAGAEVEIKAVGTFNHTKEMLEDMDKKFSENEHYDCFFFVFLTFSEPDGRLQFKCCENKPKESGLVHLEKIVDVVKNLRVTRGKPKIFLIQADDLTLTKLKEYEKGPEKVEFKLVKIPTDVDRLIIQSTIPQKIVTGEGRKESFLIQAFVEAIRNNSDSQNKQDFLSLTTTINGQVSELIQKTRPLPVRAADMPVPLVTSTLTKLLNLQES
jgi:hypothetical protein